MRPLDGGEAYCAPYGEPPFEDVSREMRPLGNHLEDEFGDVVAKARAGLGFSRAALARQVRLGERRLGAIEAYAPPDAAEIAVLALALGLHAAKLAALAAHAYAPDPPVSPSGIWQVRSLVVRQPQDGFASNCHLVADGLAGEAAIVDPGAEPDNILSMAGDWRIRLILVTHGHRDHVGAAATLARRTGAPAYLGAGDRAMVAASDALLPVADGQTLPLGRGTVRAALVPGHTPGGITYLFEDPAVRLACVGDSLFAGSLGRANASYADLLAAVRSQILALPAETALFCGHGPPSTVAQERQGNPFFGD